MQFDIRSKKGNLRQNIISKSVNRSKQKIIDDDDLRYIIISKDDILKKSKITFETNVKTSSSSDLNVASATTNKFLSYDHSFSRNYEINASVVRKDDNLFVLTSAHHNVKKSIFNPVTQYAYKNLEPLYDFDFGSTEMLLNFDEKDKDFVENVSREEVANYVSDQEATLERRRKDAEGIMDEYGGTIITDKIRNPRLEKIQEEMTKLNLSTNQQGEENATIR